MIILITPTLLDWPYHTWTVPNIYDYRNDMASVHCQLMGLCIHEITLLTFRAISDNTQFVLDNISQNKMIGCTCVMICRLFGLSKYMIQSCNSSKRIKWLIKILKSNTFSYSSKWKLIDMGSSIFNSVTRIHEIIYPKVLTMGKCYIIIHLCYIMLH